MENGNLADAQLHALIDVAAAAASAHRLEEVLELAAERSLKALDAASLSISRMDVEAGLVRTLVNVGDLAPGEERFPKDETYSVEDYPELIALLSEGRSALAAVDDPGSDPAQRELIRRLGKESSLSVAMMLEGKPWGELEVTCSRVSVTEIDSNRVSFSGWSLSIVVVTMSPVGPSLSIKMGPQPSGFFCIVS